MSTTPPAHAARSNLNSSQIQRLNRRALHLAHFTIAYNVIEAAVMISTGIAAGLVSVVGFGIDSSIESLAAVILLFQLRIRLSHGHSHQISERRALKLVAITFFLLAAYVTAQGIIDLTAGHKPDDSPLAIAVLIASMVVMPLLGQAKVRIGKTLKDPLILADAAETWLCLLMSASTLLGLVVYWLTGAAWLDPVAGFVIALLALHEGKEAWEGEPAETDADNTAPCNPSSKDQDA
jgi:divalent metal cation (Fe/Co/Zn/Cd) transporter